ncbi:MAG: UDP-N-acetylmuramoyl-L-alanine--D-glutamate ligase [Candidatus Nealsonbacteria bacterium]
MKLKHLEKRKILILGLGLEGIDSFIFLKKIFPKKVLGVGDRLSLEELNNQTRKLIKENKEVKLHLGKDYLKALKKYDIIIKSPGIPPRRIKPFLTKKQEVISSTKIFFDNCPGKIVGITGTKGKSTTSSLIYKILKENLIKAYLVGNIGKPALSFLLLAKPNNVYVYELSSHQLLDVKKSPQIAVFLNIYPEHLDYYQGFKEYVKAKANIAKYQNKEDFLVYNSEDRIVKGIAQKSKAEKISINSVKIKNINTHLKGKFNLQNIKAAMAVGRIFKISDKNIIKAIKRFKPLPHRLEYIGVYKGIKFYNDALATIPEATMAALDTLGQDVQTIFLGGFDRGRKFDKLVKRISKSKIKNIILFQTTGDIIWREIISQKKEKQFKVFIVQNMEDAVKLGFGFTKKGKICLLSTASPSFGLFRNYKEKGNLFKKYIKKHGKAR